ncbi:hypothetical protein PSTG_02724 [Puccinia striiformis f. sp. tritici PST-78]|uniref:Uncharacterized protein n=1 Tax=Puccinia striiformis f. sp. tritici PST-78 TaxID=1165861 RepID=A0A0L0VYE4_9BASI|nr:hypothetical protein PSTG_02724 [Puccinia striiformis f. sp. tritici PST-78]
MHVRTTDAAAQYLYLVLLLLAPVPAPFSLFTEFGTDTGRAGAYQRCDFGVQELTSVVTLVSRSLPAL